MKLQSHKMTVSIDEHSSHLEPFKVFFKQLDDEGVTIEKLPRQRIEDYQLKAINSTLAHIWNRNEYYRSQLVAAGFTEPKIESLEHLTSIPLLKKAVIRGDKQKILCVDHKEIGQVHLTSGTSGVPTYTSYTLADQYIYDLLPKYLELFKESEVDVAAIALPYEFALPGLGFQRLFQFAFGMAVLSLGKGGYMAPVDKSLELMKEYQATVLATTPSYAALLAEESERAGIKIGEDIRLKKILLTGEGCSATFRERLEKWWGCEVSFFYGSTECGGVAVECSEHNGYHVMEGHVKVEIIDPVTEERLPNGRTGEIIVTTLLREGMPMVRYRSGDIGNIQKSNCACGITMDLLHLRGRMENMLHLGGEDYSPFMIEHFLMEIPDVGMWYHFKLNQGVFKIEAEPFRTELSDEQLAAKIRKHMSDRIGIDCEVEIRHDIPRTFGKATRVFI
ncbi:phenylacetate--CoA ligase family protein [Paenibacillus psychroresistens]|uniref:Phenylacetate--CoA ligase family protein n=1 Tax=Paenibacillus psychroresistens TaxID=1778678 RepID=A0A6B8RQU7_9BACL|nr:AMP-binding protein [Paenibacillus psychroresistens]QGQ98761.1 phenylacetate--CoA ligase family protein [Paenibacillus psychroresistens]